MEKWTCGILGPINRPSNDVCLPPIGETREDEMWNVLFQYVPLILRENRCRTLCTPIISICTPFSDLFMKLFNIKWNMSRHARHQCTSARGLDQLDCSCVIFLRKEDSLMQQESYTTDWRAGMFSPKNGQDKVFVDAQFCHSRYTEKNYSESFRFESSVIDSRCRRYISLVILQEFIVLCQRASQESFGSYGGRCPEKDPRKEGRTIWKPWLSPLNAWLVHFWWRNWTKRKRSTMAEWKKNRPGTRS